MSAPTVKTNVFEHTRNYEKTHGFGLDFDLRRKNERTHRKILGCCAKMAHGLDKTIIFGDHSVFVEAGRGDTHKMSFFITHDGKKCRQ